MGRSYEISKLQERLVSLLHTSETGLSGVEISEKLDINRVTMAKYLGIFAAQGVINQKSVGNVTLWFVDGSSEQFDFPNDYFAVQKRYAEFLQSFDQKQIVKLVQNCVWSGATVPKMIHEVIIPGVEVINNLFDDGKIGTAEENLMRSMILESIKILDMVSHNDDPLKNVIVLSADSDSQLVCDAACALYHSSDWSVFSLGNMSYTADVLFDLDLQKLLSQIWRKKNGVMLVVVFSNSTEGMSFFVESITGVKKKYGKNFFCVMCGPEPKKDSMIEADLLTPDLDTLLQWSETVFQSRVNK